MRRLEETSYSLFRIIEEGGKIWGRRGMPWCGGSWAGGQLAAGVAAGASYPLADGKIPVNAGRTDNQRAQIRHNTGSIPGHAFHAPPAPPVSLIHLS